MLDIDFLRASRDRVKQGTRLRTSARYDEFFLTISECLEHVFSKRFCLFVHCKPEQLSAVQTSLKTELGLSSEEFRKFKKRVPGPILWGSWEALTWLANGLQAAEIPCRIRHTRYLSISVVQQLEPFAYPEAHGLSIADAYADSKYRWYGNGTPHFSEYYRQRREERGRRRRGLRRIRAGIFEPSQEVG